MSSLEELQQYVAEIASEAEQTAVELYNYSEAIIQRNVALFSALTASTQNSSAQTVRASFASAQKDVLKAAQALFAAAEAGKAWSGDSQPVLKRVLRPGGRG